MFLKIKKETIRILSIMLRPEDKSINLKKMVSTSQKITFFRKRKKSLLMWREWIYLWKRAMLMLGEHNKQVYQCQGWVRLTEGERRLPGERMLALVLTNAPMPLGKGRSSSKQSYQQVQGRKPTVIFRSSKLRVVPSVPVRTFSRWLSWEISLAAP